MRSDYALPEGRAGGGGGGGIWAGWGGGDSQGLTHRYLKSTDSHLTHPVHLP